MRLIYRSLFTLVFAFLVNNINAQLAFSPFVDSIASLSTDDDIMLLERQLSGDTTVTIDGQIKTISSRHYLSIGNELATQFIFDKFEEYGYTPEIQYFNEQRGANVIATKTGLLYPDKIYIICGHYDNMPSGPLAPGADDNASGTVATMEAARILSTLDLAYTVKFIAWDEEETGLVGSNYYAQLAYSNGEDILGVINLDMIAWDSNDDLLYSISTNPASSSFSNDFITTTAYYQPQLSNNFINTTASDHASFWEYGYPAFLAIEDWYDFNDFYHTPSDNIPQINMYYFGSLVRAAIANLASNALDQRFYFQHEQLTSGISTEPRETSVVITGNYPVDTSSYKPRLYYSIDGINFNFLLPLSMVQDTFYYEIPGFPIGTTVNYYFAVQDDEAKMIATYPGGGKGISPPGTIAPASFFTYEVNYIFYKEYCPENVPVVIPDNSNTYSQVTITEEGEVFDADVLVDITHPRTSELRIMLITPDYTSTMLSNNNGGEGNNYTQTIFDDQASQSIAEGEAPFTGRFRPEVPLSSLNGKQINGIWKLRIVESGLPNSGSLNNWCLHLFYRDTSSIGLPDISSEGVSGLLYNFPNPAVTSTSIKFSLENPENIIFNLFDAKGIFIRTLSSGQYQAGDHIVVTSVSDLEPGVYHYTLQSSSFIRTGRMVVVR